MHVNFKRSTRWWSDLAAHLRSDRYRRAEAAATATASAMLVFRNGTMGDTEHKLAAAEGTWAYHCAA